MFLLKGKVMSYIVKFVRFLNIESEGVATGEVNDSGAIKPVIMLYQGGVLNIPKDGSFVLVHKASDGDSLYLIGSYDSGVLIKIDNNTRTIQLNNCNEYTINITGDLRISCDNAIIEATNNVDLGGAGGGEVLTTNAVLLDSNSIPITITSPGTTKTRAV